MSELRDFLYLDTIKVQTFVSQISGGIISEINETVRQQGGVAAGFSLGVPQVGVEAKGSKGKESAREQKLLPTDAAYFSALYDYLQSKQDIEDISNSTRNDLEIGQFVELHGVTEPPVIETWIHQVEAAFELLTKYQNLSFGESQPKNSGRSKPDALSHRQMKEYRQIINFLVDFIKFSRDESSERQYIRAKLPRYNVWTGLVPDYVIVPLQSALPANVRILGRVERLLGETEDWKIVDLSRFGQATQTESLIKALSQFNMAMGRKAINESDLQATYPDIFITPIAIYR